MCNQHLLWPEDVNDLKRRGGLSCQDFWNREDFQEVSEDSDFCAGEEDSGESQDTTRSQRASRGARAARGQEEDGLRCLDTCHDMP